MAIRHTEKPKSLAAVVDYKNPTSKHEYAVWGSNDKNEILLYVAGIMLPFDSTIDATTGNVIALFPNKVDATEFSIGYWDVTIHYANSSDTVDVTFTLGVQSVKIYEAIAHVRTYDLVNGGIDTDDVPDFGTTIGVNGDEVEGCEVEVGKVEFSITRKWQTGQLDPLYVKLLADLTDRTAVNDALFTFIWLGQQFNFTRGTIRIRGAPLKWDTTGALEITYHFAYQRSIVAPAPTWDGTATYSIGDKVQFNSRLYRSLADNNTANLLDTSSWTDLGPYFPDPPKVIGAGDPMDIEGWQYLWVFYKTTTSNNMTTKTPIAAVVDQVYPYADFSLLQL